MSQIRLVPPAGVLSYSVDGQNTQIASDGTIALNAKYVLGLLGQGWAVAPDEILVSTMAAVGTARVVPGFSFFESTLGKPVWRNAANSAWVDAMANVVG